MPVEAATQVDLKTLIQAAAWSLRYLIDPKRGHSKSLPSDKELQIQFPNSSLKTKNIENWLFNKFGSTDLAKIAQDQLKIQEALTEIEGQKQTPETATVPHITPPVSKPRVSALGVLAELESVEPILERHRQEAATRLSPSLEQKLKTVLPSLKVKGLSEDQIATIAQEVAAETSRESLENVAKIQDLSQINQVLADSLTQSIIAHPQLSQLKVGEEKLFERVSKQIQDISQTYQQDFETSAVLGNIDQIAKLAKPDQEILSLVSDQVEQTVEAQAPLTQPSDRNLLKGNLAAYLVTYVDQFEKQIAPDLATGQISFKRLAEAKEAAHNLAIAQVGVNLAKSTEGKAITAKIGLKPLAEHLGSILNLKPLTPEKIESLGLGNAQPNAFTFSGSAGLSGFGVGLALNSSPRQQEAYYSLLAYNKPKLDKSLEQLNQRVQWFRSQKSLSYRQRIEFRAAQKQLANLKRTQEFTVKQPGRFKTFLAYFRSLPVGKRLDWASGIAWNTTEAFSGQYRGVFVPRSTLANPAGGTFGSLALGLGKFHFGRPQLPSFGMGKSLSARASVGLVAAGVASGIMGRIIKGSAAVFGGLFFYFLGLGQAAATGFVIGAAIGGTAGTAIGAYLGFQIGVALAPFTFGLSIPVFTFLGGVAGGFIGGSLGGLVGGLIALGIAAGSATMVSMGVGAGIGGAIGGFVGASVGGTVGGVIGGAIGSVVPFAGTAAGAAVGTAIGTFVGTAVGTFLGALTGAAIGYLFGHYILPFFGGTFDMIGSLFSGTAGAGAGALGVIGGFFTGLASGIWGGITGAAGATFGFLSGAANFIVGGLSSLAVPASAAAIPVVGGIGAVAVGGTIVGIVTATAFSVAETDQPVAITPGENEFFTLTKTADKTHLSNPPPNQDLTFTITLTAKDHDLTNVQVTDQINVQTRSSSFSVTQDKNGRPISPVPCPVTIPALGNCTYSYTIVIDSNFNDSVIVNTVTAKTTPTGQSEISDSVVTTVTVGNPPAQCPRGWPAIGDISQGPEGASSHADAVYGGYEAIDIAQGVGNDVFATVEGTVDLIYTKDGNTLDQRIRVRPTSCAGLNTVNYWHLSEVAVSVGQTVTWGQKIGKTGNAGSGPHMHYQFNEVTDRSFKIAPPYIPQAVPRTCDSISECGVHIPSAP